MPLYEYQCEACGQRFEKIQKFSDPPLEVCAVCGKGPVHKLLSTPAIQFKGTGWYITDYAQGRSNAASSSSANETKDTKSSEGSGSSEAKPAKSEPAAASAPAPAPAAKKD